MKKKILIVEDDLQINNMLLEALEKEAYEGTQAFSGTEALLCVNAQAFDLVLLDLMLPGMNGDLFLKKYREKYTSPIIVLSSKDELDSKVNLLTMGADDYITKPFQIKELLVRISVQLRKTGSTTENNSILRHKNLTLNKEAHIALLSDVPLSLTKQEFKILELLIANPERAFSKQEIYDYAWDEYFIGEDKTINVHISNIRGKLKKISADEYIDTVWGIGFKLSNRSNSEPKKESL